jgi:hypothetical protein
MSSIPELRTIEVWYDDEYRYEVVLDTITRTPSDEFGSVSAISLDYKVLTQTKRIKKKDVE